MNAAIEYYIKENSLEKEGKINAIYKKRGARSLSR
jgi:hypothetical protein